MPEQRLRSIFEYQRFENNERLSAMLSEALERYDHDGEGEISDEEAGLLNAAEGNPLILWQRRIPKWAGP